MDKIDERYVSQLPLIEMDLEEPEPKEEERVVSPVHSLAAWFWANILEREEDPWTCMGTFKRYLKEASMVLKQYNLDPEIVKVALRMMKSKGLEVRSIHLPINWSVTTNGPSWYDKARQWYENGPPIYQRHDFKVWCKMTDRMDLWEEVHGRQDAS
jgi:hypothetical protein